MALLLYNTLTRTKEEFIPVSAPNVSMYVCGITPYDESHIGHGRAYVAFDLVRRYLEYSGYKVNYIQNITDIDDKIINRANEKGLPISVITEKFTASFFETMDKLKIKKASSYPKATEHISEMIAMIADLVAAECAYESGGDVYFNIGKCKDYGKLSGRDIEAMPAGMPSAEPMAGRQAGIRVDVNEKKSNPLDFVLWKAAKEGEPSWDSPWGKGRPGWHSECVVMAMKYLGSPFDIHGGGADLIFPHHENEIAQASCLTGSTAPFANYWMHNGFITVNKEKMSKSLGNFFTLKDILEKYDASVVRYFLIRTHYRSPINFSYDDLDDAAAALAGIKNAYDDMQFMLKNSKNDRSVVPFDAKLFKSRFVEALDDDINSPAALAAVFDLLKFFNENKFKFSGEDISNIKFLLEEFNSVFQFGLKESKVEVKDDMDDLLNKRNEARKNKDWALADKLRDEIESKDYVIEDTPFGAFLKKKGVEKPKVELKVKDPFGIVKK